MLIDLARIQADAAAFADFVHALRTKLQAAAADPSILAIERVLGATDKVEINLKYADDLLVLFESAARDVGALVHSPAKP